MVTEPAALAGGHTGARAATFRKDAWWVAPALSVLFTDTSVPGSVPTWHALFGEWPSWWPDALPASPALLILIFPGIFRLTCYYYRKSYYRALAGSPPACTVVPLAKGRGIYKGETGLLRLQNLHRVALYFALPYVPILYADAVASFIYEGRFGVGVGSFVLLINATLLAGYTFGCHSFRHLIGGHDDCMSCGRATVTYKLWRRASWLNERHMVFAWMSLLWVAFSDVYVRLVSLGIWRDLNTWHFN